MNANQLNFYRGLSNFWNYSLPVIRGTADFRGAFKSYMTTNDSTLALVENLTASRQNLSQTVSSNAPIEMKLKATEEYLPLIYLLYESVLAQGSGLRADKELIFEWKLYLNAGTVPAFRSNDIVFEIIMVLHLKACLHYSQARSLLDADQVAYLTEAGKQLVTAAGILDHIESNIKCNKWNRQSYSVQASAPNPAEVSVAVCAGLSLYYRSLAQILAVLKAMSSADKPTPVSVKTRLSVAVITLSAQALQALEASSAGLKGKLSDWLSMELLYRTAVNREVFTALSYFYFSHVLQEKQEIGNCIAYAQFAKLHLQEQTGAKYNFQAAGLPKSTGTWAHLSAVTSHLGALLDEHIAENDRTNRFVTFQVTPTALQDLPKLPPEAVIMNSAAFVPPAVEEGARVPFVAPEKKSFIGSIFGFGAAKGKSADGAAPAKPEEAAAPEAPAPAGPAAPPAAPVLASAHPPTPGAVNPAYYAPLPAPQATYQPTGPPSAYSSQIYYPSNASLYPTLNNNNGPAGPSAPYGSQTLSDEEYARQLQQQYNNEANNTARK